MKLATAFCISALTLITTASAQTAVPDFSTNGIGWQSGNGGEYVSVDGSPSPTREDPRYPYVPNGTGKQPTFRIGDISNPNLKQWAKDVMKKDNDEVIAGKFAFTARSSCRPAGVPGFDVFLGNPLFILQSPKEVTMIFSGNAETRHIHLNASHSTNPKPSWYGESIGHYEGDTLVIDTIGLNDKTFLDNY